MKGDVELEHESIAPHNPLDLNGRTVVVDGKEYRIELVERINRDSFLMGETDFVEQVIRIDGSLKRDRRREVLLHELLHCVFESAGDRESNEDERLICTIASGFNQILSQNEWLFTLFLR